MSTLSAQADQLSVATGTLIVHEAPDGKAGYRHSGNEPNSTVLIFDIQEPKPCVPACSVGKVSSEQRFQIS